MGVLELSPVCEHSPPRSSIRAWDTRSQRVDWDPGPTLSSIPPPGVSLPRIRQPSLQETALPTCTPGDSVHQKLPP